MKLPKAKQSVKLKIMCLENPKYTLQLTKVKKELEKLNKLSPVFFKYIDNETT